LGAAFQLTATEDNVMNVIFQCFFVNTICVFKAQSTIFPRWEWL